MKVNPLAKVEGLMRADRLLSILLLLQIHRRLTARELARRLEVSERTIHRDMEALSAAGVPVYAERGPSGGWVLQEKYQTNLTGLTEAEIQALFLALPDRILDDLGLHQASEAALIKLLASLPSISRRDAEFARQRIHVDAAGWQQSKEAVKYLTALQEAIWQERQVYLTYQRGDESTVERLIDPLGLVAKGSTWYLVAAVEGELRTYRVSRVQAVKITDQPCARPEGFDLAGHWEQSTAEFKANLPRFPATLRVAPEIRSYARAMLRYARIEREDPPDTEGWITWSILFEEEHSACEYASGFGPKMEVVEPASLREQVIEQARAVITFYAQRTTAHPHSQ
jgi:predicted DNA-binding transcriptional regulator YafY